MKRAVKTVGRQERSRQACIAGRTTQAPGSPTVMVEVQAREAG